MKSIQRNDFIIVGVIEKSHGTKGELKLSFEQKIKLKEWVFIEINEKPVPFFIESVSRNQDQPVVKLVGIDSPNETQSFIGMNILFPADQTKGKTRSIDVNVFGYLIMDENYGELGRVEEIEEVPQQVLLHTTFNGNQLLIPAVDAFIKEINHKKQVIYLSLPEGLIEL